jgi:hypothetical protein
MARKSLKDKRLKRCIKCGKGLRHWNKSGYCAGHKYIYYRKTEIGRKNHTVAQRNYRKNYPERVKEYQRKYYQKMKQKKNLLLQESSQKDLKTLNYSDKLLKSD